MLRPGWVAEADASGLVLRSDTRRLRVTTGPDSARHLLLALAEGPAVLETARPWSNIPEALVRGLVDHGVLMRAEDHSAARDATRELPWQDEYFSHVGVEPTQANARLASSNVLVLGLGGTGSVALQHLVGAGVRNFVLVDHDVVERSNLGRQFIYSREDVGAEKTRAAAAYIRRQSASANIRTRSGRIRSSADVAELLQDVRAVDFCVICVDEPAREAFDITAGELWRTGIPCIHSGVMIRSGFYGPLFDRARSPHAPSCFSARDPTRASLRHLPLGIAFAPVNTVVAASMAAETLHYLVGAYDLVDFERRTFLDLAHGRSVKIGPGSQAAEVP